MKLKYISVLKVPEKKRRDEVYCVKAELKSQPDKLWFKQFQIVWAITPSYNEICPEPKLKQNEIYLEIQDSNNISTAIEALQAIIPKINMLYYDPCLKISEKAIVQYFYA